MKLHEALNIDLSRVDEELVGMIRSDPDLPEQSVIFDSIIQLIRSGGKRLRPMMVILGGRFGNVSCPGKLMKISAAIEFLHMASLIHDDIIDNSDMRRNAPALHKKTGVPTAIHIANYMLARAMEWALDDPIDAAEPSPLASVIADLCVGEYQQLDNRFNFDLSLEAYLAKTRNKTALLMASCLETGAIASQADAETSGLLHKFGDALGMAFQIRDDVLDFIQAPEILGKPAGSDLLNGNVTLPALYALESPELNAVIRSLGAYSTVDEIQHAVRLIAGSEAIGRTLKLSGQYIEEAKAISSRLEAYPAHQDLETLLNYFVTREK